MRKTLDTSAPTLAALATEFDLSSKELAGQAQRLAERVHRLAKLWAIQGTPEHIVRKTLHRIVKRQRVRMPSRDSFAQQLNRLRDPAWWRRALRQRFQCVELQDIRTGQVHAQASPYVSPKSLRRHEHDRRRMAELLASLEVVNDNTGELLALGDVVANSQANPANRRSAMMVRIKGIERHALAKGHEAHFLTITAPSRMHPRHSTGAPNDKHDGTHPRKAQQYLNRVWRKAMRSAKHHGLSCYGLRVVEPHHDACPHWHVLVFTPPSDAAQLLGTFRSYALADSPDEPGAAEHRFKVEAIDPAKGSAVGYVAKYVSKSIDGEGIEADSESDCPGDDAARRIVAWARLWRIRQFQFFGVPAITPTRELYRHDGKGLQGQGLCEAHRAAKANDYAAWLYACEAHALAFRINYSERDSTRYPDETARVIQGLNAHAADLPAPADIVTRTETWSIQPRPGRNANAADRAPWTRFNNCAAVDSIEVLADEAANDQVSAGSFATC